MITLGSNDDQDLTGEGGVGPYASPEWITEYRRRVGGMMDVLTANSDRVLFWVGVPVLRVRSEDRYNAINQIFREEAAKRPGRVVYIDLDTPFRGPDGGYADYINGVQVRTPDGTHFNRAGGDQVAQMVIDAMNRTYDLSSWRTKVTAPSTTVEPGATDTHDEEEVAPLAPLGRGSYARGRGGPLRRLHERRRRPHVGDRVRPAAALHDRHRPRAGPRAVVGVGRRQARARRSAHPTDAPAGGGAGVRLRHARVVGRPVLRPLVPRRAACATPTRPTTASSTRSRPRPPPRRFDRDRPLWEYTLVEGLPDGKAAFVMKVHHSMTDGVGGIKLLMMLLDLERDPPPSGPEPDPLPLAVFSPWSVAMHRRRRAARRWCARLRRGRCRRRSPRANEVRRNAVGIVSSGAKMATSAVRFLAPATTPASPLLRPRSLGRQVEAFDVPLDDLKRAAKASGVSLNDAFVGAVLGGMHRYHEEHNADSATSCG